MPTVKDNAKGKRKRAHIMTRINALRKKLHIPKRPKPGELPEIVAKNHKCYKASYTIATVLFMWMVTSLEHSWLYLPHVEGTPAEKDGDAFACMWLAAIAAWCAYFFVQGTDAGYVRKEEMEQEGRGLLAKGDGDGATPEDLRAPIPVDPDFIEPHMRSEPAPSVEDIELGGAAEGGASEGKSGPTVVQGQVVQAPQVYCEDCELLMPARAKHCRHCNMCVSMYDHHCGIIGTCVGERNHCRFWWYLFFQSLELCVAISIVHSGFVYRTNYSDWISANGLALFTVIMLYIFLIIAGPLLCFHSWLAATNTTSYETTRGTENLWYLAPGTKECDLPFSRGLFGNLRAFCCVRDGMWEILGKRWSPSTWKPPGRINHESDDIWENPWHNKYYSCC